MTIPDITPSNWWFLDEYDADVSAKVGRLSAGVTATNIVSLVPTSASSRAGSDLIYAKSSNRVLQVNQDDVYAQTAEGIWKSTDIGSSWTMVHTFTDTSTENQRRMLKMGPFLYSDQTGDYLCGVMYPRTGGAFAKGWRLDLATDNLTMSAIGPALSTNNMRGGHIFWRNILYFDMFGGNGYEPGYFDPARLKCAELPTQNFEISGSTDHTHFVGNDGNLYMIASDYSSGRVKIARLRGGCWFLTKDTEGTIDDPEGNTNTNEWYKCGAFNDPETGDTALLFPSNVGSTTGPVGWTVARMTAPYTAAISFPTTVVLPSALTRWGSASTDWTKSVRVIRDVASDPQTPGIFLLFQESSVTTVSVYQWKGFGTAARFVGNMVGASGNNAFPDCPYPDATRLVGVGTDIGRVHYYSKSGLYTKIHYSLDGSGGSEEIRIRWYDLKNSTSGLCTFVSGSGSGGSTASGQSITGVTADGSEFTVDWDYTEDGLSRGDNSLVLIVEYESGV